MSNQNFSPTYEENAKYLDSVFGIGKNYDFVGRERVFAGHRAKFYFIDGFANSAVLDRLFIYLAELPNIDSIDDAEAFAARHMPHTEATVQRDLDKFIYSVMSGTVGIIIDSINSVGITIDTRIYPMRGVSQSENDRVLRGAHDSFTETIKQNSTLIRRRIRDPKLTFEQMTIGETSKTDVVVAYIDGKADMEYVKGLISKIKSIKVNALTLGQQSLAECLLKRNWYDPFPKFRYTERPDNAAAHLLEGSVIVLTDTSPEAMILPTCLFDFMEDTNDYYLPPLTGSYLRILRYAVFALTLLLTPTWYLLITHVEWIPEWLNFILVDMECNMPILLQLYIVELALDGLKLASMNTPNSLNNTFGVVGGLILGDFAVQIGWFVPEVIVYMAFVAIANFSQSSYELGYTFKFMRVLLLTTTAIGGLIGYIGGIVAIIVLAACNKTVNGKRNYLYPLIPFNGRALKRHIVRERLRTNDESKR